MLEKGLGLLELWPYHTDPGPGYNDMVETAPVQSLLTLFVKRPRITFPGLQLRW